MPAKKQNGKIFWYEVMTMRIGIYQGEGIPTAKEENLAILRRAAIDASEQGAGLIVFPELFLTGYNIGDRVFEAAEPSKGPSAQKVADIARKLDIAVLYGYPEKFEKRIYNSALLIDAQGNILANCRKTHLYGDQENSVFQPGDELILADLDGLKVGLLICYDIEFPEAARMLALAGAELIAVPTALMEPYCRTARILVPARALENQLFVAYANRCGAESNLTYCGLSCVVGPDGEDLVRAGTSEGLFIADIDVSAIAAAKGENPYLADLRPDLYATKVRIQ